MEWVFGDYTLNSDRAELMGPEGLVPIEQKPLELLVFLAKNADRVVTKDEVITHVWGGRIVSEATISTAVKQARRSVGDTGRDQVVLKTIHGRGYRFVAETTSSPLTMASRSDAPVMDSPIGTSKPSIAVMRFLPLGEHQIGHTVADAIPAEIISSLSRLHWLRITARGSSFRFHPKDFVPEDVGQKLNARYLVSGTVECIGDVLTVSVELQSSADGQLLWSDRYAAPITSVQSARREIVSAVISALELVVARVEADHTRDLPTTAFDAWSHYHLGLKHMFLFNQTDNLHATKHFEKAVAIDPEFARAHGGISFTRWQQAFMHFGEDRRVLLEQATEAANLALKADGEDPFANYNMGRAMWLKGDLDAGIDWLERAIMINPNYAQGHYTHGLTLLLSGAPDAAGGHADQAMSLSPLDPLYYAMLSTRAMTFLAIGDHETALKLINRATHSPGAHFYIHIIAAMVQEMSGDLKRAQQTAFAAKRQMPSVNKAMFFEAFPFAPGELRQMMAASMDRLGL